ncbi:MAG TPA: helix-turn-helix domain-containing protein [Pyrinomonadaceae bacterium]|nr:helix-turn-helix domain-containing protein [Pyrinomonadaceae bacterium]
MAREFENKGEYEEARKVLSDYWRRVGERPKLAGLEPSTGAEVLLRVGVLTGLVGSRNRITDAQEIAKNLISESLTVFESQRYKKKIAEAQTELALCYWRTGELNEARDLLSEALSGLTTHSELTSKTVVRLAIVECEAGSYSKALRLLTENAPLFQKINNQTLKGSYHVTLGTVLRHLWESKKRGDYLDRALIEYAAASYHFEQAEHSCYLANVENQLGLLYFTINRCDEAHEHLDRARRVLVSLKDIGTIAQVDETRSCAFLKQGRVVEAEQAASSAVYGQEKTDRHALLAEALITHGRALARLKRYGAALAAFRRAFDLSEYTENANRSAEAALAAFHELREHLAVYEDGQILSRRGLSKKEQRSMEHEAMKLALENANGSVVHAARSLGISYQSLTYMLNTRHKDLLKERSPVRRRPRAK